MIRPNTNSKPCTFCGRTRLLFQAPRSSRIFLAILCTDTAYAFVWKRGASDMCSHAKSSEPLIPLIPSLIPLIHPTGWRGRDQCHQCISVLSVVQNPAVSRSPRSAPCTVRLGTRSVGGASPRRRPRFSHCASLGTRGGAMTTEPCGFCARPYIS